MLVSSKSLLQVRRSQAHLFTIAFREKAQKLRVKRLEAGDVTPATKGICTPANHLDLHDEEEICSKLGLLNLWHVLPAKAREKLDVVPSLPAGVSICILLGSTFR
jgi:hypothetical protein